MVADPTPRRDDEKPGQKRHTDRQAESEKSPSVGWYTEYIETTWCRWVGDTQMDGAGAESGRNTSQSVTIRGILIQTICPSHTN